MLDISVSDRFHEIDGVKMHELGMNTVDAVMTDLKNRKLSLREVAHRNNMTTGTVVQIARFHKINPVTLEVTD